MSSSELLAEVHPTFHMVKSFTLWLDYCHEQVSESLVFLSRIITSLSSVNQPWKPVTLLSPELWRVHISVVFQSPAPPVCLPPVVPENMSLLGCVFATRMSNHHTWLCCVVRSGFMIFVLHVGVNVTGRKRAMKTFSEVIICLFLSRLFYYRLTFLSSPRKTCSVQTATCLS